MSLSPDGQVTSPFIARALHESLNASVLLDLRAATLIAGSASRALVPALQRELGRQFSTATIERFPDGEVSVRLEEPVRGEEVILRSARCRWPTGMRRNSIYRWRCATRAVFAPGALGKMAGAGVRSVFVTDTILTV